MDDKILDFQFSTNTETIIKIIGVGGGGGNAVNHMYNESIPNVSFALCNTDQQDLNKSLVKTHVQLGKGLGAGNRPLRAEKATEESIEDIERLLDDGTKMVFITAGMGGGTGTGASPVIARIAKSMGILTVGIVTIPFAFEGRRKITQAFKGVMNMAKNVDALLIINNERLIDIYADWTVMNAFAKADEILATAVTGIIEIITAHGYINLDFADVNTILKNGGIAIMSSGYGEGNNRIENAIENALHSPLLNNNDVSNAKKILFNIYSSNEYPLIVEEMEAVTNFMEHFHSEIEVIWGTAIHKELGNKIKITLLATGFGMSEILNNDEHTFELEEAEDVVESEQIHIRNMIDRYYGIRAKEAMSTRFLFGGQKPIILSLEELDDDRIINAIESTPIFKRDKEFYLNMKRLRGMS